MHIVFVSREYVPSLRSGGIAAYVKNVAEALAAKDHRVTVIRASDDTRLSNDEIVNNVRVISLPGGDFVIPVIEGHSLLKKFRGIYRFRSYRKKIRNAIDFLKNVDIIEVAEFGAEGLYLQNAKSPVVCRLHTPSLLDRSNFEKMKLSLSNFYFYFQGLAELSLLKKMNYITSCSVSLTKWVEKYAGINEKGAKVIYNPVNIIKKEIVNSGKKHAHTILFAGTITEAKGVLDLFEAGKIIEKENSEFCMEMAGKMGGIGEKLKLQETEYKWLNVLGKLSYEQLMQKYKDAAIVCIPSWWENMPMVCIEAMMCGAIVIGSSSGGMSEVIADGEDGFLLEPRNPQRWAEKIQEIFTLLDEERLRISQNAQKKIRKKFSMEIIIPQMIEYYENVMKQYRLSL
jgi:glycosyltransferase involved in cell wall biosynthesis